MIITVCGAAAERPGFGLSKGGGIPGYVFEAPVIVLGTETPAMLAAIPQARACINPYDGKDDRLAFRSPTCKKLGKLSGRYGFTEAEVNCGKRYMKQPLHGPNPDERGPFPGDRAQTGPGNTPKSGTGRQRILKDRIRNPLPFFRRRGYTGTAYRKIQGRVGRPVLNERREALEWIRRQGADAG